MSIINYASREIQFKIVYYGPALCGKTTNLGYIHQRINPQNRGDLVSLATAADRTLFFDFLPLNAVCDQRLRHEVPALHRARPGHLQRHPPARPAQRRWHRFRGRFAVGKNGGERRELQKSRRQSGETKHLDRRDSLRLAIQQTRPAKHRAGQLSRIRPEQPEEAGAKLRGRLQHGAERFRLAQRRFADSAAQV